MTTKKNMSSRLPPGVRTRKWKNKDGTVSGVYVYRIQKGGLRVQETWGALDTPLSYLWKMWEERQERPTKSIFWLLTEYLVARRTGPRAWTIRQRRDAERRVEQIRDYTMTGRRSARECPRRGLHKRHGDGIR